MRNLGNLKVIVRTLMLAVLKAAPENLRENLLRAVGAGIKDQLASLDFGTAPWFETLVFSLSHPASVKLIRDRKHESPHPKWW